MAADLGILPEEIVVALGGGCTGRIDVPKPPLPDHSRDMRRLQHLGHRRVAVQQRSVRSIVAANRGVPHMLSKHQRRSRRGADRPGVGLQKPQAVLRDALDVRRCDAPLTTLRVDRLRDRVVAEPQIITQYEDDRRRCWFLS
jgi:hypothetical protein